MLLTFTIFLFLFFSAPIDIQSILNGAAKFCRHCDVVIMNNLIRKKASEKPLVAKQGDEDMYFCSSACYMQVALTHPHISVKDKVITYFLLYYSQRLCI